MDKYRILLVNDYKSRLARIGGVVEEKNYSVTRADTGKRAIRMLNKDAYDLVITDLVMKDVDGFEVVKRTKEVQPDTATLILTGHKETDSVIEAFRLGVDDFLPEPCETEDLLSSIERCLEKGELKKKNKRSTEELQRRVNVLNALQLTMLDITKPHELSTLLHKIVERAVHLLNAKSGGMYLCHPEKEEVVCMVSYNTPADYRGTVLKFGEGAAGTVAQSGKPLIIDDYSVWRGRASVFERDRPFTAIISVPMVWQGQVTGVIHVLDDVMNRRFSDEHLDTLTMFANHAAIALENTQLHEKAQQEISERIKSEARFVAFMNHLPGVAFIKDRNGRHIFVNKCFEDTFSLTPERWYGKTNEELFSPDMARRFSANDKRLMQSGIAESFEEMTIHDGKSKDWLTWKFPILDDNGRLDLLCGIAIDITERKRIEETLRESEEKYRNLIERANDGVIIAQEGKVKFVNSRLGTMFGYAVEEMINTSFIDYVFPDDRPRITEIYKHRLQGDDVPDIYEMGALHRNGRKIDIETNSGLITYDGKPATLSLIRDITERKQAEEALRESERRFRRLFQTMAEGVVSISPDGQIVQANTAAEQILGLKRSEIENRNYTAPEWEILRADGTPMPPEEMAGPRAMREKRTVKNIVMGVRRPEGTVSWINVSATPIVSDSGELQGVVGTFSDISERKKMEEVLSYERDLMQTLLKEIPDFIYFKDSEARFVRASNSFGDLFGCDVEQIIGKTDLELFPKEIAQESFDEDRRVIETGMPIINKEEGGKVTEKGETWVLTTKLPWIDEKGNKLGLFGISRNITEQKKASKALQESEKKYRQIVETVPFAVTTYDPQYNIIEWNSAAERIFGWSREEAIEKKAFDLLVVPDQRKGGIKEMLEGYLKKGGIHANINQNIRKDGQIITCRWQDVVISNDNNEVEGVLATAENITQQVLLEEQLQQAQKMEAVGRLCGGIAHDFNNLLTTILGYSDLISLDQAIDDNRSESIGEIKKAAERAATLTHQLLAFSRKQVLQPKVLRLNGIITNLNKMLKRLIGEDINLNEKLDPNLSETMADPGQIEQIIMNLAVNARDAMPKGGTLTIETKNVIMDESYRKKHPEVIPGKYVLLLVNDTGFGMDEETKERIFEPFFTTKGLGEGTGLGLSTVYGIVKQSRGYIWVDSKAGEGSSFRIYLPSMEGAGKRKTKAHQNEEIKGGTETILLVEDEQALRRMARKILEKFGYQIIEASNGEEALSIIAKKSRPQIDLVITDVVMPDMSGKDLAIKLHNRYPELKILYISGYTDNVIAQHGVLDEGVRFLQKPFSPSSLTDKVRDILDEK